MFQLKSVIEDFEILSLQPQINSIKDLLGDTDNIYVAIFGRFKAGKSSFLNDLIGKNLLPTGVLPVTAILTTVQYGQQNSIEVIFQDGRNQKVIEEELPEYITEKGNPGNKKLIQEVRIHQSSLEKYAGLVFVDTPGLGSIFTHNTKTSLESLPKVQLALIAIGVDPPLSEQDLSLIREARRFTSEITIIVTKVDLINKEQLSEIDEFIKVETKKAFNESLPIYFYSVRNEFKDLHEQFDKQVLLPLLSSKEKILLNIAHHKLKTLKSDVRQYLEVARALAEKSNREIQEITNRVLLEEEQGDFLKREIGAIQKSLLDGTREIIRKYLFGEKTKILSTLTGELEQKLNQSKGSLWAMTRLYEEFLEKHLKIEMNSLISAHQKVGRDYLNSAKLSFTRVLESFRNRTSQKLKESLGVEFDVSLPDIKIDLPEVQFVPFPRAFDTPWDVLSFLFPPFIFKSMFVRHFLKEVPYEIEKNISRLTSAWSDNINTEIDSLAKQMKTQIENEIKSLKNILTIKTTDKTIIETALRVLREMNL